MTTKQDISRWFNDAPKDSRYMVVMCDTFDMEDYPIYVRSSDEVRKRITAAREAPFDKVMEVYKLSMDKDAQLNEHRAFNY